MFEQRLFTSFKGEIKFQYLSSSLQYLKTITLVIVLDFVICHKIWL